MGATNLEMKLNMLLKRSEAVLKQQVVSSVLDAAKCCAQGDGFGGICSLLKGLAAFRDMPGEDPEMNALADQDLRISIKKAMADCKLQDAARGFLSAWSRSSCSIHG